MKKLKTLTLGLALLSMMGLSSCLNSSNDGTSSLYSFLKVVNVYGSVYFTDAGGTRVQPATSLTTNPTSELVYAYMEYNTADLTEGASSITVSNFQYANLPQAQVAYVAPTEPGITCSLTSDACMVWGDNEYFIFSATYYIKSVTSSEQTAELAKHQFYVYTNPETDMSGNTLTVHLRQVVPDLSTELDGKELRNVYTQSCQNVVFFRLKDLLTDVNSSGYTPTKIRIAYQQASSVPEEVAVDAEDQKEAYTNEVSLNTSK